MSKINFTSRAITLMIIILWRFQCVYNNSLGPNHICSKSEDCVNNADCIPLKEVKISKDIAHFHQTPDMSICRCQEGYIEIGATCGGRTNGGTLSFLVVALVLYRVFN